MAVEKKAQIKFPMSIHLKFANNGRKTTHIKVLHGKLVVELPVRRHLKELPWQKSHYREIKSNGQPFKGTKQLLPI